MFKRDVRLAENTLNKQDEIISQMKVLCYFLIDFFFVNRYSVESTV